MSGGSPVVLASGLPLGRPSSFSRQLRLLAEALVSQGLPAVLCGPEEVPGLLRRGDARALVLLGYPDQFPFLRSAEPGVPAFLWAQLSRVPPSESFAAALPVPLTRRSAEFLRAGGCPRIGPVIPHGVDVGLYRPASAGERAKARERQGLAGKLVVGTVGAHSRRKRFDLILDALARLREEEPSAVLLAKTDRTVSLEGQDLELEARRRGLEGAVRLLLGELAPEAMVELYRGMDLYLNLSEWEGFCLPVVEAMACGVPVVCQPGQGPGEIVPYRELMVPGSRTEAHGPTALLRADPEAAAAVLREAARAPARLERLSLLGRQAAQESYGIDRVAGLWAGLLRETTERSPRALRRGTPPARPGSG